MSFMETRGMLARCLATENLIVEHDPNASTACFATEDRILRLPVLETASEYVYTMFVGHEVGHALQTPPQWYKDIPNDIPFDFVNVIEDIRIEEYIQDKYPGLRKDFRKGYNELLELDFFDLAGKDPNKLSFIDRVNLNYKLGERAFMPFSDDEQPILKQINSCKTWEDVVQAATDLMAFLNARNDSRDNLDDLTNDDKSGDGEDSAGGGGMNRDGEPEAGTNADGSPIEGDGYLPGEFEIDQTTSQTQRKLDENLAKLAEEGKDNTSGVTYLETPDVGIDDVLIPIEIIRQQFIESRQAILADAISRGIESSARYNIKHVEDEFTNYLLSIKPDVSFMVQQFEMKKSADAYARQQVHKTGVLNTNKLHQYKITEDLFLSQTVLPNGKSHGLVMFVDWSGSMSNVLKDTLKQVLVLVQFCRKAQIPFEVYTFTSGKYHYDNGTADNLYGDHKISMAGIQSVRVLSSNSKKLELEQDMLNLWLQVSAGSYSRTIPHAPSLLLNGTPLNNLLFMVPSIIKRFRELTKSQIVSFVALTDGQSNGITYHESSTDSDGNTRLLHNSYQSHKKNKLVLREGSNAIPVSDTNSIIQWLTRKLEDVTFTNIFIGNYNSVSNYCFDCGVAKPTAVDFKKKNGHVVKCPDSWPLLVCMNTSDLKNTTQELEVGTHASKGAIVSALRKFLKGKMGSKRILSALVTQFS